MKNIFLMLVMMLSLLSAEAVFAGDMINVNTASIAQLQTVKGIGPKTAAAIVDYRESHGDFANIEGLTAVKGIGDKKLAKIQGDLSADKSK